jgi:hypothetical protein
MVVPKQTACGKGQLGFRWENPASVENGRGLEAKEETS